MDVNFSAINMYEKPILILKRPDGTPIGVLGNAVEVGFEPNYNEISTLSFRLPAKVDGSPTPFYNETVGLMLVELKGIGQFVIKSPEGKGDKLSTEKNVTAESLECEFTRKKITLPESTYKFFDSTSPSGTILSMLLEEMPTWSIGTVAENIKQKYRTFEVSNENLYNFIKGTVQQSYNCIFEFDTLNRVVNVRDADAEPSQKQVFISRDNLAKDITVREETDDIVTRLDVSGADGVDIRDVNPTGTNKIINLDYFMGAGFFSSALVTKYNTWKTLVENNRLPFYNYSVRYALRVSEEIAEKAKLADLQGEYTSLDNIRAVVIQGIASGLKQQDDLDAANRNLAAKQTEINAKNSTIASIQTEKNSLLTSMQNIRNQCAYDSYFTAAERQTMSPYIIDNEIQDSSFVASEVQSYSDGVGNNITNKTVTVSGGTVTTVSTSGATIRSISGGTLSISGIVSSRCVSAIFERRDNGKVTISIYCGDGTYMGSSKFPSACVSITGTGSMSSTSTSATSTITSGTLYFSLNATDYEKKSVAWDLYEYGDSLLEKMAYPSYTFSVNSANFLALDDFALFKNELELGQRIYIEVEEGKILQPICTGARIKFDERPYLELIFTDTYTANDGKAKLISLLDKSVSMGKTLSAGKFTYEAWTDSGADTDLKQFITSALDTAKNSIMSSTEQAVSWDGAGFRLRRYRDNSGHSAYDGEQIWMSNNSIMMTDDGWATAKMAIGKFHDSNTGDTWGIIAPMIMGTLLAGSELVIEAAKKYNQQGSANPVTTFRVDADGARLYNADFQIQKTTGSTTTQILLDPSVGVAMGTYPLKKQDGSIDTANAKFWVDTSGNMHLTGSIITGDGSISGWTIAPTKISSGTGGNHVAISSDSSSNYRIWAGHETASSAPFSVQKDGTLTASKGTVGGWYIGEDYIGNASTEANSSVGMSSGTGTDIVIWAGNKTKASSNFYVQADGYVAAANLDITGGSITIKDGTTEKFKVTNKGAVTAADITITGGSMTIKDGSTEKFKVTNKGAVTAADITITGGSISIKDGSTEKFKVTDKGAVTASDLTINGGSIAIGSTFSVDSNGSLTASSGTIGGWYISANHIGNTPSRDCVPIGGGSYDTSGSTIGMTAGSDPTSGDEVVIWAGGTRTLIPGQEGRLAPFRVERDGDLYCSNGTFGGTVYATQVSTANGALVSGQIGNSEIKSININASAVTENKISGNAVSYGKTASGVQTSLDHADTTFSIVDLIAWEKVTWVRDVSLKSDGTLDVTYNSPKLFGVAWSS